MITFKQFLEAADGREVHAKIIEGAPNWTPYLSEGSYKFGDITFSAKDGLGSVPNNQSVNYMGFVALCRPSMFLRLALDHAGERDGSARDITELIQAGYAGGIPWLVIDTRDLEEGKGDIKVTGHEGRARMLAIKGINGDDPMPIHCFLSGGMRSRHMTPDITNAIKEGIQAERSNNTLQQPFKQIYIDGKPQF